MTTYFHTTASFVVAGDILSNDPLSGLAARNGYTPVDGDLMLATGQTDQTARGPYVARAGLWDRVISLQTGQQYYVASGTDAGKTYQLQTASISPASFNSTTGACATNLSLAPTSGPGGLFNPASPGAIGGTTAAPGTFTSLQAATVGSSGIIQSQGNGVEVAAASPATSDLNYTMMSGATTNGSTAPRGVHFTSDNGTSVGLTNGSAPSGTASTSSTRVESLCISLANNATFDYALSGAIGGSVTVSSPATGGISIGATLHFGSDGSTSLGGLTPTNVSATLTTAGKLNLGASAGKLRIENKLGSTQTIVALITLGLST